MQNTSNQKENLKKQNNLNFNDQYKNERLINLVINPENTN